MAQLERAQVQVEQLEAIDAQDLVAPPHSSWPQDQICNADSSPPPHRWQPADDDMSSGKAPPPSKFDRNR